MPATTRTFLADLWRLTKPYWFSEERWAARGLLAAVVAINLCLVYLEVVFSFWQNDFYNTIQNKDEAEFYRQLLKFSWLAAGFIVAGVYQLYLNQMLQIRWRRWLTDKYLNEWIGNRVYYRMQLTAIGTDNPDQRIAEDLALFCDKTLYLVLGVMSAVITLLSFLAILWRLSGTLTFEAGGLEVTIPGYMVWVALVYAVAGTALAHWIGRPLIRLNFDKQMYEADFRFALVRFRENTEAIALYRGEAGEIGHLRGRFSAVAANWWGIMRRIKKLNLFSYCYNQAAIVFPFIVVAPRFFSGKIQLGDLMQTATSFNKVQSSLSWFIDAYSQLAAWRATVDRLITFHNAMLVAGQAAQTAPGVAVAAGSGAGFTAHAVEIDLPGGQPLLTPFSLEFKPGESVLVTGPSGSGKSTLFRAFGRHLAVWPR